MYVHTLEGAIDALGITDVRVIKRRAKKALERGKIPSKIICGTEYFDLDILDGFDEIVEEDVKVEPTIEEFIFAEIKEKAERKIERTKKKSVQLDFSELFDI